MISIVIPAYNEEEYLPKLLKCIGKQTYKDYEVIVADANSKDRTGKIAIGNGCRIAKGGLPGKGRNNGAKISKGEVLFFIDADVQFDKNFLKTCIVEFNSRNLDAAGLLIYPQGNRVLDRIFLGAFNLWTASTQFFYPNASGSGIMCKKWLHKKIHGFDEKISLSEDMDYARRCGKQGKFRILNMPKSYVAMRRFEKEGYFKIGVKLILSAVYRLVFGEIRSNIFNYNLKYRK